MRRRALLAAIALLSIARPSEALLLKGAPVTNFVVHDPSDKAHSLLDLRAGRAAMIVYEDKTASPQNASFKKRVTALLKTPAVTGKVVLLPIADVSNYDYFPAKSFVKDALEDATKKSGYPVYADWSTKARSALSAHSALSNLVLVDSAGKVLWSSAGQLTSGQEDELLARVKKAAG